MSIPNQELLDFDVATLSTKLHAKEISPVELTEAYLARIEQTDKSIRAYITVTDTLARKAAKKAGLKLSQRKTGFLLQGDDRVVDGGQRSDRQTQRILNRWQDGKVAGSRRGSE